MISVVITTYNGAKYIEEQLESIRKQTLLPDEVLIFDDRSTDETVMITNNFIEKHSLTNWHTYINETKKGFIKNFIDAICATTGDIVFLSDQDDVFLEKKLEKMHKVFQDYPDCKTLNSRYIYIDDKSNVLSGTHLKRFSTDGKIVKLNFTKLLYHSNYPGFAMAFRGELRQKICNISVEYIYGHDLLINLLGVNYDGCYELRDVLSKYRLHNANTSGIGQTIFNRTLEMRIKQKEKEMSEYELLEKFCRDNKLNNVNFKYLMERKSALARRIDYFETHNVLKALCLFPLMLKVYPAQTLLGDLYCLLKRRKS